MTDKEKERLKDDLNDIVGSAISSFWMNEYHDEHERRKLEWRGIQDTINSLIDRQPTEEEAKEAWDVLQQGLSRCESVNEKACARCSKFKGCQEGEETIRKALGIEEDKCQK